MSYAQAVGEAVRALRVIRGRWADLLLAIETPPADHWPPRQLAHTMRDDDELLVEDWAPLVLREHPAPLNLGALDAGQAVERLISISRTRSPPPSSAPTRATPERGPRLPMTAEHCPIGGVAAAQQQTGPTERTPPGPSYLKGLPGINTPI